MPKILYVVIGMLCITSLVTALNVDRLYRQMYQIEVRLKIAK